MNQRIKKSKRDTSLKSKKSRNQASRKPQCFETRGSQNDRTTPYKANTEDHSPKHQLENKRKEKKKLGSSPPTNFHKIKVKPSEYKLTQFFKKKNEKE